MIKVLFCPVRELVNTDSLTLEATFKDVAALRAHLAAQSDRWALALDEGSFWPPSTRRWWSLPIRWRQVMKWPSSHR